MPDINSSIINSALSQQWNDVKYKGTQDLLKKSIDGGQAGFTKDDKIDSKELNAIDRKFVQEFKAQNPGATDDTIKKALYEFHGKVLGKQAADDLKGHDESIVTGKPDAEIEPVEFKFTVDGDKMAISEKKGDAAADLVEVADVKKPASTKSTAAPKKTEAGPKDDKPGIPDENGFREAFGGKNGKYDKTINSSKIKPKDGENIEADIQKKFINNSSLFSPPKDIKTDGWLGPQTLAALVELYKNGTAEEKETAKKELGKISGGTYGAPNAKVKALIDSVIAPPPAKKDEDTDKKDGTDKTSGTGTPPDAATIKNVVGQIIMIAKDSKNPNDFADIKASLPGLSATPEIKKMVTAKVTEIVDNRAAKFIERPDLDKTNIDEAKALSGSGLLSESKQKDLDAKIAVYDGAVKTKAEANGGIAGALKGKTGAQIKEKFETEPLKSLPPEDRAAVFQVFAKDDPYNAALALKYMKPADAKALASDMAKQDGGIDTLTKVLEKADIGNRAKTLIALPPDVAAQVLTKMGDNEANEALYYGDSSSSGKGLINTNPAATGKILDKMAETDAGAAKAASMIKSKISGGSTTPTDIMDNMSPAASAKVLAKMPEPDQLKILSIMAKNDDGGTAALILQKMDPQSKAAELLSKMSPADAAKILATLNPKEAAAFMKAIAATSPDKAAAILDKISAGSKAGNINAMNIVREMEPKEAAAILSKSEYPGALLPNNAKDADKDAAILLAMDNKAKARDAFASFAKHYGETAKEVVQKMVDSDPKLSGSKSSAEQAIKIQDIVDKKVPIPTASSK